MSDFAYPIDLEPQPEGGFTVTFPDLPFGVTEGDTEEEAQHHAVSALETVMEMLIDERKDIPLPSAPNGRPTASLPPLSAAKVALYRAARERGMTKAELGRRLALHPPQVERLFDIRHASRFSELERALGLLGKQIELSVRDVA